MSRKIKDIIRSQGPQPMLQKPIPTRMVHTLVLVNIVGTASALAASQMRKVGHK